MPRATIDIGTNTVLLLIYKKTAGGDISPIHESYQLTRLGEGLGNSNHLTESAMKRTLDALMSFKTECFAHHVASIKAVGTAALRKAKNSNIFVDRVKQRTGIDIKIITGEEEALLSYLPAQKEFGDDIMVVDIGGASTEFIWTENDKTHFKSLDLGCVTLLEKFESADEMKTEINKQLGLIPHSLCSRKLIGIAGTVTTLVNIKNKDTSFNHERVHGATLTQNDISQIEHMLLNHSLNDRKTIPGLEPARADVIVPGVVILKAIMTHLNINTITASHHGIRFGLALNT